MLNAIVSEKTRALFTAPKAVEDRAGDFWRGRIAAHAKQKGLQFEVVEVTPALAEWLLLNANSGNRQLRQHMVDEYARQITEGLWQTTAQAISLTREGQLNNGQHRLSAIVKAAVSVKMAVAFNEPRQAFEVLDVGAKRSQSDALRNAGFVGNLKGYAALAATINGVSKGLTQTRPLSNTECIEWVAAHREAVSSAVRLGESMRRRCVSSSLAGLSAGFFIIARDTAFAPKFPEFVEALIAGEGLSARSPIYVLREALITNRLSRVTHSASFPIMTAALMVRAWNRHIERRASCDLKWLPTEQFPKVR